MGWTLRRGLGLGLMLCYLATPIDQAPDGSVLPRWRLEFYEQIKDHGWCVYDPSRAFPCTDALDARIQQISQTALDHSDAIVALLPRMVPSYGVPMEVGRALAHGKPTIVAYTGQSFAMAGSGAIIVSTVEEAAKALLDLPKNQPKNQPYVPVAGTIDLLVRKLDPDAQLPVRAYDGDAGMDLVASKTVTIPPGGFEDVPTGLAFAIPYGFFGRITSRSSTFRKRRLDVREGVIDSAYRGEIFSGVHNASPEPAVVQRGERVAQLLIHRVHPTRWVTVDELPTSTREERGFGSSGT